MKSRFLAPALFLILISFNASAGLLAPEVLSKGEALFNTHCVKCHGQKAAGTDNGPPLVNKIYHPNHHADLSFRWAVQRGVASHHWRFGNMPKIDGVNNDEIDLLIKYIRHLQKEAGIY